VRVLDFETVGRSDTLWSTYTGPRRQVRVRYWQRLPWLRLFGRASAGRVWSGAAQCADLGGGRLGGRRRAVQGYLWGLLLALVAVQLLRAGTGSCAPPRPRPPGPGDRHRPRHHVGSLQRSADHARPGFDLPDLPTHYYLVVDDGTTDELRPWLVNRDLPGGPDGADAGTRQPGALRRLA